MNFIYKCYLQKLFSSIPRGEKLNYLFQKYITKSLPVDDEKFLQRVAGAKEHFHMFTKYRRLRDAQDATYYEFGAGWDLINPIALSLLGMQKLYCIDIRELVFPELLNDTISKFCRLREKIGFGYSLSGSVPLITRSNFRGILMKHFGIQYEAPMDARCTTLEDSTIDFIVSNSTLEHNSANKFFDSLSASKPVLLNYSGWQRKILEENKAGFGCKQCNTGEFVERVSYLNSHRDELLKMGRNARRVAIEKFDRDKLAMKTLEIIAAVKTQA